MVNYIVVSVWLIYDCSPVHFHFPCPSLVVPAAYSNCVVASCVGTPLMDSAIHSTPTHPTTALLLPGLQSPCVTVLLCCSTTFCPCAHTTCLHPLSFHICLCVLFLHSFIQRCPLLLNSLDLSLPSLLQKGPISRRALLVAAQLCLGSACRHPSLGAT